MESSLRGFAHSPRMLSLLQTRAMLFYIPRGRSKFKIAILKDKVHNGIPKG